MPGTVTNVDESDTYYADCDWSEQAPSIALVELVASAQDREVDDVPQLYDSIDPDALDLLVGATGSRSPGTSTEVNFVHAGCRVTVTAEGSVTVRATD